MVLAAKDDRLPDCITRPEPVWADTPAEPEKEDEPSVPEGFYVPDVSFNEGEQGTLIPESEYGEATEPEIKKKKEPKARKQKEPKPRKERIFWRKLSENVKSGLLGFYDEMVKEDE